MTRIILHRLDKALPAAFIMRLALVLLLGWGSNATGWAADAPGAESAPGARDAPGTPGIDVETIIMVRHGEKPAAGLGQLNCQGLNRALALPHVIEARFGRPDIILAPDPAQQKRDQGVLYDYVRPLATIEPTAIYFGMPIHSALGFANTDALRRLVLDDAYRHSTVLLAWEHSIIEQLARQIVQQYGGDPARVPHWRSSDFDSIYVLRIERAASGTPATTVGFKVEQQGLNGRASVCPLH